MFRLVSFVVTALLVGTPAYAQDKTSEIDKIFSWATPATPGCAVAVSQHGKLVVNRAYGSADLERDVPIEPELDLRCRIGDEAVRRRGDPPPRRRGAPFSFRRRPQAYSGAARLRPQDHGGPSAHPYQRHSRLDRDPAAGSRKCRRVDHDPASARPQFRARRGMVLFEQRLCAAERNRRAHERDVVRRIHAQAPVRAARDEDDHLPHRSARRHQEPRPRLREGGQRLEDGDAARQRSRRRRRSCSARRATSSSGTTR